MKKYCYLAFTLLIVFFLLTGCNTLQSMKTSVTEKVSSTTSSDVDQGLFKEVPRKNRAGIQPAMVRLRVAQEVVAVDELKKKMAAQEAKYAEDSLDLAKMNLEEATLDLEILKLEAIDKSNLGDKQSNITEIADMKAKKLRKEADRVTFEAKLVNMKQQIDTLDREIQAGEKRIRSLKK